MPRPTQGDINKSFSQLQKQFRKKYALKKVEQLSGIAIEKQSQINILALYSRLRQGTDLPPAYRDAIRKEKKDSVTLTPAELIFFKQLMAYPFIANHATEQADRILANDANLYSTNQLKKYKIKVNTHAASHHGEDHFVFFSYGLPAKINVVDFVGQADLFLVNLQNFQVKDPLLHSGMWSSGHFYAYEQEQVAMPIEYKLAGHSSRVYTRYEVSFSPVVAYKRHFVFQNEDGICQQSLLREMEISAGRHIKPYHILRLIEFLRFLDPRIRQALLANASDARLMAALFDSLFTPGKAEIHIPEKLHIDQDPNIFSLQRWHHSNLEKNQAHACIVSDADPSLSYETLAHYLKQNIPLHLYRFNQGDKRDYSLLNLAVLKKRHGIVQLLLSYGISADHTYRNVKQKLYFHLAERSSLQDAIELHDSRMIKLLCELPDTSDQNLKIVFCASVRAVDMYTAIVENADKETFLYLLTLYKISGMPLDELLLVAIYYSNTSALNMLLEAKANPNTSCRIIQDSDNAHLIPWIMEGTALTFAAQHARLACITILLPYANPNAYIQECGSFAKYGHGKSPLLLALENLFNPTDEDSNEFGEIDNCRYRDLQRPAADAYHRTIELLIAAGANTDYRSVDGISFASLVREYAVKHTDDPFLKSLFSQKGWDPLLPVNAPEKDKDFRHESYALITRLNTISHREELLIAEVLERNKIRWAIPGGRANYQKESDLEGTVINISGYQLGIDLSQDAAQQGVDRYTNLEDRDDSLIELRHYRLPDEEKTVLYKDSPHFQMLVKKRGCAHIPNQLKNIRFIALEDIKIALVPFQNSFFPLCTYQNMSLPYLACVKIALMSGISYFDRVQAEKLAFQLHFKKEKLFNQGVACGDLSTLKSLIQLKLDSMIDQSGSLVKAMESGQYDTVGYLLQEGFRFAHQSVFLSLYYRFGEQTHSEEITIVLCKAHEGLLESCLIEALATYAGKNGYAELTDFLRPWDENVLLWVARSSVENGNLASVKMVLSKIPTTKREAFISPLFQHCRTFPKSELYQSYCEILNLLLIFCPSKQLQPSWLLNHIGTFYQKVVEKGADEAFQKKCLVLIEQFMQTDYANMDPQLYRVFLRLTCAQRLHPDCSDKYRQAAENLLAVIIKIPAVAIRHASKMKMFQELDALLKQYYQNPTINTLIRKEDFYLDYCAVDAQGDNCLHRAVKTNNWQMLRLLLQSCYNHNKFDINALDRAGNTALQSAQTLGHFKIAKLLQVYSALYAKTPETVASVEMQEALESKKLASNIMCYAKIGRGQGFGHIIKLARLIQNSEDALVAKKWIYVVGDVQREKIRRGGTAFDKSLYTLLTAMYPEREKAFYMKSPEELLSIFNSLQQETTALPIRLFLNVDEAQLQALFNECEYSVCAYYKGASLEDPGIRASLDYDNIIYSHLGDASPKCLQKDGEYHQAMVLFDERGDAFANNILADLCYREGNRIKIEERDYGFPKRSLNQITRILMKELITYCRNSELSFRGRSYENHGLFGSRFEKNQDHPLGIKNKKREREAALELARDKNQGVVLCFLV